MARSSLLQAKLAQLEELKRLKEELDQLSVPQFAQREYAATARKSQLPPDDPRHSCQACNGVTDTNWNIWLLMAGRGYGKDLRCSTPVPTPSGWTTMGELAVGDKVFDEQGQPCNVVAVFEPEATPQYRLTFSDSTELFAGRDHQWVTLTRSERKKTVLSPGVDWAKNRPVRTTQDLIATFTHGSREDRNHCVPVTGALDLPSVEFLIDPYVLGFWLGDGHSTATYLTLGDDDFTDQEAVLSEIGVTLAKIPSQEIVYRAEDALGSLVPRLRTLGVYGNKHLPQDYMRSSVAQRLAVLQGLMDSDGSVSPSGQVEFCSTNETLARGVTELARSLGQKPVCAESRAQFKGKDCGPRWRVTWRPTIDVFRLPRKKSRIKPLGAQGARNLHRMLVSVEEVPYEASKCIMVDSPNSMYLAGEGMIPTHNTFVGASWILHQGLTIPNSEWLVVAPTFRDVQRTCFEGDSGILKRINEGELKQYLRNELQIKLANGSKIHGISADEPERARGLNLWGVWADEIGSWRRPEIWYEGIIPALRKGENPRAVVTTTPRPTKLVKDLYGRSDGTVHMTRGSTFDNREHLSAVALDELRRRYDGTRLGSQELYGALLEDIEGALFKMIDIEDHRIKVEDLPEDLVQVVVAVDPAVTSDETSDLTGIIVVASDDRGHGYVLADKSLKGSPEACMREAVRAYHQYSADTIVAEVNNGGDYIGTVLQHVDPHVPFRVVRATRGKEIRAEPVAALYEQGRIHHVGMFTNLEEEMCEWIPGVTGKSPDRLDALVWAVNGLNGLSGGSWSSAYGVVRCVECDRPFVLRLNPDRCPKCGTPHQFTEAA